MIPAIIVINIPVVLIPSILLIRPCSPGGQGLCLFQADFPAPTQKVIDKCSFNVLTHLSPNKTIRLCTLSCKQVNVKRKL